MTRTSRHLLKYIKINDQNHGRHALKMLSDTKQQRLQSKSSAHVQRKTVSSVEAVSRRNTLRGRPSAGVFPRVFVSVTVFCVTVSMHYADSHYLP